MVGCGYCIRVRVSRYGSVPKSVLNKLALLADRIRTPINPIKKLEIWHPRLWTRFNNKTSYVYTSNTTKQPDDIGQLVT